MPTRCPHCGKLPYPLFEDTVDGKKYIKGSWKNLFKMDLIHLLFVIIILILALTYGTATEQCRDVIKHPCDYVKQFDCDMNPDMIDYDLDQKVDYIGLENGKDKS